MLVKFPSALCYLVKLVHAEATHFGLDVFAHVFGGRQKTTLGLKPQNTHTHRERSRVTITVSHSHVVASDLCAHTSDSHIWQAAASSERDASVSQDLANAARLKYLDLDAERRSVCWLVEDRTRQVGETQSAAAVDVHHLVTSPRWTNTRSSSMTFTLHTEIRLISGLKKKMHNSCRLCTWSLMLHFD